MGTDELTNIAVTLGILGVAYGLTFWVHRAQTDRSARVGLYLIFGIPGALLVVLGAAFAVAGRDFGWVALLAGIGLCAPLAPHFRAFLARWTPLDPKSAIDMSGLCIVLGVIGFLFATYVISPEPADVNGDVDVAALLVQFLFEIALAYIIVGFLMKRDFRVASERLGLVRPTVKLVAVAVALVVVAYIAVVIGGTLTYFLQPDVSKEIDKITKEITSDVQNPIGAAFFGIGAGAGEELLLRGAIQPRFGLLITAVLFALLHSQYGLSFVLGGIFVVGLLLGLERKYFGTTAAIITHAIFNTIAVLLQ